MENIKLFLKDGYKGYFCDNAPIGMLILGDFFKSDVGCGYRSIFGDWAKTSTDGAYCSGNITGLEIEGDDIVMTDLYPEVPGVLRISREQFINLFNEWLEKVCKTKPKEVIIFHDNGKFWIETKN